MIEHGPLLERLLAGEFVCAVSDDNAFRHLANEETRDAIDDYLRPLNRRLANNDEGSVYFLAWRQLNEGAREQLSRQLSDTVNSLLPLLEWLQLVQEALGRDTLAAPGDVLKPAEFSAKCEDNQSLRERLERLATDSFFGSQSDQLDAQVKQLFKRLKEHGYLLQPHTERQVFVVTGKIDYLIEVVRFIRDEENLPIDVEQEEGAQEALL
ncbi:condensin complex protein MksE [Vreelandella zhaodongensis]|uniref:condensin complex protein MksE n=1 Tax=Vreelandella zhaodongensis TaxID=1176240 RepID=UPI003EBD9D29